MNEFCTNLKDHGVWSAECVALKLKSGDPNTVKGSQKIQAVEPFDEQKDRDIARGVHSPVLLICSKVSTSVRETLKAFINTEMRKNLKVNHRCGMFWIRKSKQHMTASREPSLIWPELPSIRHQRSDPVAHALVD